jgi:diguanylate cyclase (GGDEF)-like protein
MKLRTQIFSGYALLALFVGMVGGAGYLGLNTTAVNFDHAINRTQPVLTALHEIRLHATALAFDAASPQALEKSVRAARLVKDQDKDGDHGADSGQGEGKKEAAEKLVDHQLELKAALASYQALVQRYFPEEAGDAREIQERIEDFLREIESLGAPLQRQQPALFRSRLDQVRTSLDALQDSVLEAAAGEEREFREQQDRIESESARHRMTLLLASLFSLLAAIGGGALLAARISRPVSKLRLAAQRLGGGDLDTRVNIPAGNEIGELAQTFNQMAGELSNSMVSRDYVETIIESLSEGLLVVDAAGNIERCNTAMRRIYDEVSMGPLRGRALGEIFATGEELPALLGDLTTRQSFECRLRGGQTLVAISASPVISGSSQKAQVLLVQDITERKRDEDRLRYLASYDVLTGLPNRRMFLDHLKQTLARLPWNKKQVGLLFCDLDRFKFVNDSLGHAVGDVLLQRITERLREVLRPGDIVGRWAGDEFVVLLDEVSHPDHVSLIADKLVERLREPIQIGPHELYVTVSVGSSTAPGDSLEVDELVKNADLAMYAAKSAGKNVSCAFLPEMRARTEMRLQLEQALRHAISAHDQLQVHYQAQQHLDGTLLGFEALVRWQHPQLGLISPAQFLPAAEEAGLMGALDESVLRMACAELHHWREEGWDQLRVAVNLSNQTFQRTDLIDMLIAVVDAAGVPRTAVELELTEEIVMENVGTAVTTMDQLCALGFSLSIDDFGTGYSSLSQLKRCPIRLLKIDRSFITDVTRDASDQAITGAIIALSHKLGIKVLAEGVETEDQLELLRQSGCDAIQGYLLSKPLPAFALQPWMAAHRAQARLGPVSARAATAPPDPMR